MIVDCHSHVWEYPIHLPDTFVREAGLMRGGEVSMHVPIEKHYAATRMADVTVVLAFRTRLLGVNVPNEYVADYVRSHPGKLIGFASVDPNDGDAAAEFEHAVRNLGLRGLKCSPIYQGWDPQDERFWPVFAKAEELGMPVLVHQGTTFPRLAPLKYANPILLEDLAIAFPKLVVVIAHMGHPWEAETIALIRKQPNFYADISGLFYRPWRYYQDLALALEYRTMHKLLFGSDYPVTTPEETMATLRSVNEVIAGTALPIIPEEEIEGIIHRDTLRILYGSRSPFESIP
jgi:predicted TIM-barrel fold metal-dependent hydrolase